jgi:hypothetical protein
MNALEKEFRTISLQFVISAGSLVMITPTAKMTDVIYCSFNAVNALRNSMVVARTRVKRSYPCHTRSKKKSDAGSIKAAKYLRKADQEIFYSNLILGDLISPNNQMVSIFRNYCLS